MGRKRGKATGRYESGETFGAIPDEVLTSEAWHWLPDWGGKAVMALAAQYRGNNNGRLELPLSLHARYGLTREKMYYGLRLAIVAGLVVVTVPARYRNGRGIPTRYGLTWKPVNGSDRLNLPDQIKPTHRWARFEPPCPPICGVRSARQFLGYPVGPSGYSNSEGVPPDSLEAFDPVQTKKAQKGRHGTNEKGTFVRHGSNERFDTVQTTKKRRMH